MKKLIWLIIIVVIVVIAASAVGKNNSDQEGSVAVKEYSQDDIASGKGRVIFGITDAAADMGSITSIEMTVDSVEVRSSDEVEAETDSSEEGSDESEVENEDGVWVTVSNTARTYDLLALKAEDKTELFAEAELDAGTYNQVRLNVSDVSVTTEEDGEVEAKLPSGTIRINGDFNVEEQSNTVLTADFFADQSIHTTGNGKFIFAPVVNLESRSGAEVALESGDALRIEGGSVEADITVGMDNKGAVKTNAKINPNASVEIGDDGEITVSTEGGEAATVGIEMRARGEERSGMQGQGRSTTTEEEANSDESSDADAEVGAEVEVGVEADTNI